MKIVNIVATLKIKEEFDLNILSEIFEGSKFPSAGKWLMWRLNPGNHYLAFYQSGKILLTSKSMHEIYVIADKIFELLIQFGIVEKDAKMEKVEIHNIVLTDSVHLDRSLDEISITMGSDASYEPEQFPGLFYKNEEGINFTLFSSGKVIITGAKEIKTVKMSFEIFKRLILTE